MRFFLIQVYGPSGVLTTDSLDSRDKKQRFYTHSLLAYYTLSVSHLPLKSFELVYDFFVPAAKGQTYLIQPKSWKVGWPHGAPSQMQLSLES